MQYRDLKNKAKKLGLRVTKNVDGKRVKLTGRELRSKITMNFENSVKNAQWEKEHRQTIKQSFECIGTVARELETGGTALSRCQRCLLFDQFAPRDKQLPQPSPELLAEDDGLIGQPGM